MSSDRSKFWVRLLSAGFKPFLVGCCLLVAGGAHAQITPDATLGAEGSTVVPRALGGDQIEGGAIRGANLFHSFSEFNVGDGGRVYFANPAGIQTILTRVTGNTASNINGTLGVDGTADLFLLNPNGILFGQNARLDVRGSFVGSTANAIGFGTQGEFSATNPQAPSSLLTVQPSALLFSQLQGGAIVNQARSSDGRGLSVPTGNSLLLVGGNVVSDGGQITVPGGRIELGGLAEPGAVGLSKTSDRWQLSFPTGVQLADLTLQNQGSILNSGGLDNIVLTGRNLTVIDTALATEEGELGGRSGDIEIQADTIVLEGERSVILAFSRGTRAGDVRIKADRIIANGGGIYSLGSGTADAGNLEIQTRVLSLRNRGFIGSNSLGSGNSGNLTINASEAIEVSNESFLTTTSVAGNAGQLTINTGRLSLLDGGVIASDVSDGKRGGDIRINATGLVELVGESSLSSASDGTGDSGNIVINANRLSIRDGAYITTFTTKRDAPSRSGDITINAADSVEIIGFPSALSADTNSNGDAGKITIRTGVLTISQGSLSSTAFGRSSNANGGDIEIAARGVSVLNGGAINAFSVGGGRSGNIAITASDFIQVLGDEPQFEFPFAPSVIGNLVVGSGAGGQISLNTRTLTVGEGAFISAGTNPGSTGRGGDLIINATDLIDVYGEGRDGRSSYISAGTLGTGDSGNISISTGRLRVRDGAFMRTDAFPLDSTKTLLADSNARGGNLTIRARDSIEIGGQRSSLGIFSYLSSATNGAGDAGDITLQTESLTLVDGAIASLTDGKGQGGTIQVEVGSLNMTAGTISTSAIGAGNAGKIAITARGSVALAGRDRGGVPSAIAAESRAGSTGRAGSIELTANSVRLADGARIIASTANDNPGGNIQITTRRFDAVDEALVGAFSAGGGNAGNIAVNAAIVRLNNGADITTRSGSTDGGNVTITASDALVLRRNSRISASAGTAQAPGNGGNIAITAGVIVSKPNENNTIQANARAGRGGSVAITTQALLGITPSRTPIPGQSTITASSELGVQGTVSINQPSIQPTQDVLELPNDVIDASNQMAQVCPRNLTQLGRFTVSGRGSLPPNPIEPLTGSASLPLAAIEGSPTTTIAAPPNAPNIEIIEAQGWVKDANGKVLLVAQSPETTPSARPTATCSTATHPSEE